MTLFRNAHYNALVACASVGAMVYYSGTVLWPGLAAALFTASVPRVGWLSCAVGGGILLGQLAAGLGVRHLRRMRVQMTLAGAITVAGIAAVASATTPATESRTVAFVVLGSAGAGYVEILALSTVALVWPRPHDIGLVAGVLGCIRTAAAALATSVYLSVLSMERTRALAADVAPVALRAGLPPALLPALLAATESQGYAAVPGLTDAVVAAVRPVAQHAYAMAYRTVFLCTLPFGLILLVAAVGWCPDVEDYMTEEVARKLQRGGAGRRVKLEVRKGRGGGGGGGGGEG
jgi:MFS family permease